MAGGWVRLGRCDGGWLVGWRKAGGWKMASEWVRLGRCDGGWLVGERWHRAGVVEEVTLKLKLDAAKNLP